MDGILNSIDVSGIELRNQIASFILIIFEKIQIDTNDDIDDMLLYNIIQSIIMQLGYYTIDLYNYVARLMKEINRIKGINYMRLSCKNEPIKYKCEGELDVIYVEDSSTLQLEYKNTKIIVHNSELYTDDMDYEYKHKTAPIAIQSGGDKYYIKYLKYKSKYMNLKKNLIH